MKFDYKWFSRYVIAAILVDGKQKIAHYSSFCLSTSFCPFHHCYLCLPRLHENHLLFIKDTKNHRNRLNLSFWKTQIKNVTNTHINRFGHALLKIFSEKGRFHNCHDAMMLFMACMRHMVSALCLYASGNHRKLCIRLGFVLLTQSVSQNYCQIILLITPSQFHKLLWSAS